MSHRQHKSRGMARIKAKAYYRQHKTQIKARAKVWRRSHKSQIRRTQKIYHRNPAAHHRIASEWEVFSDQTIDFTIGQDNHPAVVDEVTDLGTVKFTVSSDVGVSEGALPFDEFIESATFVTIDDQEMFFNLLDAAFESEDQIITAGDTFTYEKGSPANDEIKQPGSDVGYKADSGNTYVSAPDEKSGVPSGNDIPHGHADQMSPASSRVTPGGEGVMWSGEATYMKAAATIPEIFAKLPSSLVGAAKGIPVKLSRVSKNRDMWTFAVTGSKGDSYTVKVKAIAPQGKPNIKDVGKAEIQVNCTCKFWQWQGPEHWAHSQKYLLGRPVGTAATPDVKDPKGNNWLCKHAIAVLGKARTYRLASEENIFWDKNAMVYSGNLGAVEMIKFYQICSKQEESLINRLLDADNWKSAWTLLKKVTGVNLKDPSSKRVASNYLRKMAGASVQVHGGDRTKYLDQVWDMFVKTYASIGLIVKSPHELIAEFPIWEISFGSDGEPVAFNVFKSTPYGLKSGLAGSDGSSEGKSASVASIRKKYHQSGYYGEASHKVEAIAASSGAPAICAVYAPKILGKNVDPDPDGIHYSRNLAGVGRVKKVLLGKPKGIPTTEYNNPSCPVDGLEKNAGFFDISQDDGIDKIAHLACLMMTDADLLED